MQSMDTVKECISGHTLEKEETDMALRSICNCVICNNLMHIPVREKCGHCFTCMSCQQQHHEKSKKGIQCPVCQRRSYKKKRYCISKTLHMFIKSYFGENDEEKRYIDRFISSYF